MINNLPKNKTIVILTACTAFLFSLAGCEKFSNKSAPPPPPPAVVAVPKPPQTQQQAVKPVQAQTSSLKISPALTNQYDFSTKKDPFKPFAVVKVQTTAEGATGKRAAKDALPIHNYDVSQFKLVGIVTDARGNRAMVVDPTGKAYVLKTGMTIGKGEGKVSKIATNMVEVIEEFHDENGKKRHETIKIPLLRKP